MRYIVLVLSFLFLLASCGSCGSPQKQAIERAELGCLKDLGAAVATAYAKAKAEGQNADKLTIAIEVAAETLPCAIAALGAKPAAEAGSGSAP